MVDFQKSFNIGISAAEKAEEAQLEISNVFEKLNKQLYGPTGGRIFIELAEFNEPLKMSDYPFEKIRKYWAIAAKNPKAVNHLNRELAKWHQNRSGYPCKISFGEYEIYCEDKEGVESALSGLLQDPVVGKVLHNLMGLPESDVAVHGQNSDSNA